MKLTTNQINDKKLCKLIHFSHFKESKSVVFTEVCSYIFIMVLRACFSNPATL